MSDYNRTKRVLNTHRSGRGAVLIVTGLVPRETATVSAQVLCTPYNQAPIYSVTVRSHIRRVYVCLAVTYYLHFCQNDRNLWRVTAVTRGWNGYGNKGQDRQLTVEKKALPPLRGQSTAVNMSFTKQGFSPFSCGPECLLAYSIDTRL